MRHKSPHHVIFHATRAFFPVLFSTIVMELCFVVTKIKFYLLRFALLINIEYGGLVSKPNEILALIIHTYTLIDHTDAGLINIP